MRLVAFDTQLLIWGVQGTSHPSQGKLIPRARALIEELSKAQVKVVVPLAAAVEYVCGFPVVDQPKQWARLSESFRLIPFDQRAAQIAAQIERRRHEAKTTPRTKVAQRTASKRRSRDIARQKVKVDVQILATAVAAGAESIFTDEVVHFSELALGLKIKVLDLKSREYQSRLPFTE
jgi:hypothetical protein